MPGSKLRRRAGDIEERWCVLPHRKTTECPHLVDNLENLHR